jgi:hypothetical protein
VVVLLAVIRRENGKRAWFGHEFRGGNFKILYRHDSQHQVSGKPSFYLTTPD